MSHDHTTDGKSGLGNCPGLSGSEARPDVQLPGNSALAAGPHDVEPSARLTASQSLIVLVNSVEFKTAAADWCATMNEHYRAQYQVLLQRNVEAALRGERWYSGQPWPRKKYRTAGRVS